MASYLDKTGLTYLWGKITTALNGKADSADLPTKTSDLQKSPLIWESSSKKANYTERKKGTFYGGKRTF